MRREKALPMDQVGVAVVGGVAALLAIHGLSGLTGDVHAPKVVDVAKFGAG